MRVEIWSDIVCPFCYLGHHRFEAALAEFPRRSEVEVTWRSFQLDPDAVSDPGTSIHDHLASAKGIARARAQQMHDHLTAVGEAEGVTYDFDRIVVANTFRAHRLTHFAQAAGRQHAMVGRLFDAYFRDGRNIDDPSTLAALAADVGLDARAAREALTGDAFAEDVRADVAEARRLGIGGVPFFVFDRRLAVSGAQEKTTFTAALTQAFATR